MGTDIAWLPTDCTEAEAAKFIDDPLYCAQAKEDGIHVFVRCQDGIDGFNRRGEAHPIPDVIQKALAGALPEPSFLDGEKLHRPVAGKWLMLFDALMIAGEDIQALTYQERWARVSALALPPAIGLVRSAFTAEEKRALVDELRAANAEGVIFKRLDAPYRQGRPVIGGPMRRLKFRKTAEVILERRAVDSTRSFEMYVIQGNDMVNVGSVSARQFYEQLEPKQIAIGSVTYLYASPSLKLVQPVLVDPPWRTDKRPADCTAAQLVRGGRFAA